MTTLTHITTSGGLISAAFMENIRESSVRQRGVGSPPPALRPPTGGEPLTQLHHDYARYPGKDT